jgi:uncharacterized protein
MCLERWFVLPPSSDVPPPPRYKLVAITWLAIYPLITAMFFFFGDPLQRLPLGIRTLVVTAIVVPAMIYLVMPLMTPLFDKWLYPSESREPPRRNSTLPNARPAELPRTPLKRSSRG